MTLEDEHRDGADEPAATAAVDPIPVETRPEIVAGEGEDADPYAGLPRGAASLDALCARGHADVVTERLCANREFNERAEGARSAAAPSAEIRGFADLQAAVGLAFVGGAENGKGKNPSFALLAHSTSLSMRAVSAINPRAFLFTSPATVGRVGHPSPNRDFVALAFTRGEPFAELVARDRASGELRFFLVVYEPACASAPGGCTAFERFSPATERDWTNVSVYDDGDLRNTVLDCMPCHQPGGPGTPKMLRMQELQLPWTHFFRDGKDGEALVKAYYSAHDTSESYAGIPGYVMGNSQPSRLEGLVEHEGFRDQPNEFPTADIARALYAPSAKPAELSEWLALDARRDAGTLFPTPFPTANASDAVRLGEAAHAYRSAMKERERAASFEAPVDLFRADAPPLIGLVPRARESDADPRSRGRSVLRDMCARCHNGHLDPTVSRANFDAERLDALTPAERALVLERVALPPSSKRHMPPARFGALSDEDVAAVRAALAP
ncbi:MAG: hypothetical protein U0414_12820 [Polyangiaceae bacterium]